MSKIRLVLKKSLCMLINRLRDETGRMVDERVLWGEKKVRRKILSKNSNS